MAKIMHVVLTPVIHMNYSYYYCLKDISF